MQCRQAPALGSRFAAHLAPPLGQHQPHRTCTPPLLLLHTPAPTEPGIHPPAALLKVLAVAPRLIQHAQLRPVALPGSSAAAHARPLSRGALHRTAARASKPPATQYYRSPAARLHCLPPGRSSTSTCSSRPPLSPDRRPCADSSHRSLNWAPIAAWTWGLFSHGIIQPKAGRAEAASQTPPVRFVLRTRPF